MMTGSRRHHPTQSEGRDALTRELSKDVPGNHPADCYAMADFYVKLQGGK